MLDLKIAMIQMSIAWEDPKANRQELDTILGSLKKPVNLVVLPEMFTTGFSMKAKALAESPNGTTIGWMERWATNLNAVVTGSLIIKDKGRYYNRLIWMPPSGVVQYYDKMHLFSFADEDKNFDCGTERKVFVHEQWRISPQICYDLRFPEGSRNTIDYDLLLYVANWPEQRIDAWSTLLKARAIENVSFTLGVNRVGQDKMGNNYNGQSAAYDYKGQPLFKPDARPNVFEFNISKPDLLSFRNKFPALDDQKSDLLG